MNQEHTHTATTPVFHKTGQTLTTLGWDPFFEAQLSSKLGYLSPARVIGVRKNSFLVSDGQTETFTTIAGRLFHEIDTVHPAVGDWVLVRESLITFVFPRRNVLARRDSGGRHRKHGDTNHGDQVIAANLDTVLIVCGMDRDFNLRRIERYLTLVYNCNISPAIVLTKADLHENPQPHIAAVEQIAFGVPLFVVSVGSNNGIEQLKSSLAGGKTAALIGSSGAGKSTLINRLSGEEIRATAETGTRVGKGRHTTTTRDLISLPAGGMVIDNPGIREIGLSFEDDRVQSAFPEIDALAKLCRFGNCSHTHEPDCRVLEAVAEGVLPMGRLLSFRKLSAELDYYAERESKTASRVEKQRWKAVSIKVKNLKQRRLS